MKKTILATLFLLILISCSSGGTKKPTAVTLDSPFIGGTAGLQFSFQDLRKEVFDGNTDPFDVVVKVENKGETLVAKDKLRVKLSGINPAEFGKTESDLVKIGTDDSVENRKSTQGTTLTSQPTFVEFNGLSHKNSIAGATIQYTLRADACYLYRTRAVSKVCVLENILNPTGTRLCEINADKPVHNSGAPVQISNLKESGRAKDKIGFTFDVRNVGGGAIFERGQNCNRDVRANEGKVYVTVSTGLTGLHCSGLEAISGGVGGYVTLYDGLKTVSCTQTVSTNTDFEQLVNIEASYDYEQSIQTQITVKSSGEQ